MNTPKSPRSALAPIALLLLLGASASASAADLKKTAELQIPAEVSCIDVPTRLIGIEVKGLFKVEHETRLERGPYISEYEDAEGTYYRAPPGGVYIGPPKDKPARGAWKNNSDGGIFVPRDPSAPLQLYSYVAELGKSAATLVPPAESNCSNTSYIRDPASKAVRVAEYKGEGMTQVDAKQVGRNIAANMTGVIGAVLMDLDLGKIAKLPVPKAPEFNANLGQIARTAVPIKPAE